MKPGDTVEVSYVNLVVESVNEDGKVTFTQSDGARFYLDAKRGNPHRRIVITKEAEIPEPPNGTIVRNPKDKRSFYLRMINGDWVFTASMPLLNGVDPLCAVTTDWSRVKKVLAEGWEIV